MGNEPATLGHKTAVQSRATQSNSNNGTHHIESHTPNVNQTNCHNEQKNQGQTDAKQQHAEDYTKEISINQDLLKKYGTQNGDLRFQFCGYWKQTHGHWKVFIYDKNRTTFDKFHYSFNGVMIQQIKKEEVIENLKYYKEHIIEKRNYKDIMNWALNYDKNYPKYKNFHTNCRRFVIRLAEYCDISYSEIDGQMTGGLKISGQAYAIGDGISDIGQGIKDIGKGNVGNGVLKIGMSPLKTVANVGVATVGTVANTVETIKDSMDDKERQRQKNRNTKIKFLPN